MWNLKYPYQNDEILNLDWVIGKVKELNNKFDEWTEVATDLQAALKTTIPAMQSDISAIEKEISDLSTIRTNIQYNRASIVELIARVTLLELKDPIKYIDAQLGIMRSDLEYYQKQMLSIITRNKLEEDSKILALSNSLDTKYNELKAMIEAVVPTTVYNRVAGTRLSLDDNNFNIYEDLRDLGMTNAEINSHGISNEYLASIVLNNRDFAINLKNRLRRFYLFSPVSGRWISHSNAISEVLYAILQGASNEDLYDAMEAEGNTNEDIADGNIYANNFARYKTVVNY